VERRSITHVLPDDKLIPVKLDGEDAFGCSEVLLPESFLDKYVIGKQLGSGFSGVVFAVSPRLPQDLAVKIINKAMLEPDRVGVQWVVRMCWLLPSFTLTTSLLAISDWSRSLSRRLRC
jgi:hypothetical protein